MKKNNFRPNELNPENNYQWYLKNDKLNRVKEIDKLINLLTSLEKAHTIAINNCWGAGKTFFCKMLHTKLLEQKKNSIYFSAWETDFTKEPLIAFLGEINKILNEKIIPETEIANRKKIKNLWNKTKKIVPISNSYINDARGGFSVWIQNIFNSAEKLIKRYLGEMEDIKTFKANLQKLIQNKNLYIIIDELDRCRPTYAIELLERIKHLFNIDGIVFILSLDKEQISHSIKSIYGNNFNSLDYLKRFVDIEYNMNKPSLENLINLLFIDENLKNFLIKKHYLNNDLIDIEIQKLSELFLSLTNIFEIQSIRTIQQLFYKVKLSILSSSNQDIDLEFLIFIIFIKVIEIEFYSNICNFKLENSNFEGCKISIHRLQIKIAPLKNSQELLLKLSLVLKTRNTNYHNVIMGDLYDSTSKKYNNEQLNNLTEKVINSLECAETLNNFEYK